MLVDHVLAIEGEPRSMTAGRVVTDHAVRPDRWYLTDGRCPTSVTVEAGQADLFLSAFGRRLGEAGYLWYFDFGGDGDVGGRDNGEFNRRFGLGQ